MGLGSIRRAPGRRISKCRLPTKETSDWPIRQAPALSPSGSTSMCAGSLASSHMGRAAPAAASVSRRGALQGALAGDRVSRGRRHRSLHMGVLRDSHPPCGRPRGRPSGAHRTQGVLRRSGRAGRGVEQSRRLLRPTAQARISRLPVGRPASPLFAVRRTREASVRQLPWATRRAGDEPERCRRPADLVLLSGVQRRGRSRVRCLPRTRVDLVSLQQARRGSIPHTHAGVTRISEDRFGRHAARSHTEAVELRRIRPYALRRAIRRPRHLQNRRSLPLRPGCPEGDPRKEVWLTDPTLTMLLLLLLVVLAIRR